MSSLRIRVALLAALMAASLIGCARGGTTAASAVGDGSPIETVEAAVRLLESKRFADIGNLACEERRDELRARFDIRPDIAAAIPPEPTVDQALGALTVDVDVVVLEETSRLGDRATVHLDSIVRVSTDRAAVRQLVQEVAAERGDRLSDSLAAGIADAYANALRARHDLDVSLPLRLVGSEWQFCW